MPTDQTPPPSPSASSYRRRASFSPGQAMSGIFGRSPTSATGTSPFPGSIASAAANAQNRRRMSITTLGLSGSSSSQTSPFGSATSRRESMSSAGSGSIGFDENVIEEGEAMGPAVTPNTAFARRMSFGARALRDVRTGNGNNVNGRASTLSGSPAASSARGPSMLAGTPTSPRSQSNLLSRSSTGGEGFSWSESLRSRAERASSAAGSFGSAPTGSSTMAPPAQQRADTVTTAPPPAAEMPKTPSRAPDHFQERILKGDFYMD